MTRIEEILTALAAKLLETGVEVYRNQGLSITINNLTSKGALVLHDGDPGEPEQSFSPLTYHFEHSAELDMFVQGGDTHAKFDDLRTRIGLALTSDRTLGGLVDWIEPQAPKPGDLPEMGTAPIKAATITVVLHFASPDPLT